MLDPLEIFPGFGAQHASWMEDDLDASWRMGS